MFAIIRENIDIIKILVNYDIDMNILDSTSNSALDYAYNTNNEKIINIIEEYNENNKFKKIYSSYHISFFYDYAIR